MAAHARQPKLGVSDQIDGEVVFQQRDVRMRAHLVDQRAHYGMPGGVGGVDDAAVPVAALACQVETEFGLLVACEGDTVADQPFDGGAAVFDDVAGRCFVAEAGARDQGVVDMLVMAVVRVEHRGDAALCPVACAFGQRAFADDDHAAVIGEMQGDGQAR